MLKVRFLSGLDTELLEITVNNAGHMVDCPEGMEGTYIRGFYSTQDAIVPISSVERAIREDGKLPEEWNTLYLALENYGYGSEVVDFEYVMDAKELLIKLVAELSNYNGRDMLDGYLDSLGYRYNDNLNALDIQEIPIIGLYEGSD